MMLLAAATTSVARIASQSRSLSSVRLLMRIHSGSFRLSSVSVVVREQAGGAEREHEQDQREQQGVDRLGDVDARAAFWPPGPPARRGGGRPGRPAAHRARETRPRAARRPARRRRPGSGSGAAIEPLSPVDVSEKLSQAEVPAIPAVEMRGTAYRRADPCTRSGGEDDPWRQDEEQGVHEAAAQAAGRAVPAAGMGQAQGPPRHHRVRGPRHGRQGRDDPRAHRTRQPARVPGGGAAGALRSREDADVRPALHGALSRGGRDRRVRSELVQPGRHRARDGVLQQGAVPGVSRGSARWSRRRSSTTASS